MTMNTLCLSLLCLAIIATSTPSLANEEAEASVCTSSTTDTTDGECSSGNTLSSVYVIGDLHGDVQCAISWVNRTNLINNLFHPIDNTTSPSSSLEYHQRLNPSHEWTWNNNASSLLFMGDYIDKGPTSKQTVQFVRELTLRFPEHVTALLGNHELELLRDRDGRIEPESRYASYSYASVHPGEYHNYFDGDTNHNDDDDETSVDGSSSISDDESEATKSNNPTRSLDNKDDLVLNLLYEASMEVYSHNAHNAVRFVPSVPEPNNDNNKNQQQRPMYAITDIIPPEHRSLARERLGEYQDAYLNTYRSGTALGDWLESRPIIHLAESINTLFVHGGVHPNVGKGYLTNGKESVDKLNTIWREHSTEDKLYDFLNTNTYGQVVYSLLTHRGNHPGYSKWESHGDVDDNPHDTDAVCIELNSIMTSMPGIHRIAVGHTPDFHVRFYCKEKFLALDSMLGRGIRTIGNEYCPWHGHDMKGIPKVSRNGKYKCDDIPGTCRGEIVRLDSDGSVNILKL